MSEIKPREYQKAGIEKMMTALQKWGGSLDASDMGTGKTPKACIIAKRLGLKLAVFAPPVTLPDWRDMAEAVGVELVCATSYHAAIGKRFKIGTKQVKRGLIYEEQDVYRIDSHPQIRRVGPLRPRFIPTFPKDTLCVFDEVQHCRRKSHFTSLLIGTKNARYPIHMQSATPFQDPTEMKGIMHALGIIPSQNHWNWCLAIGKCVKGPHGGLIYRGGHKHMAWLHEQIKDRMDRVLIEDVGDLPEFSLQTRLVPVEDGMSLDRSYLEDLKECADFAETGLTERLRFRQISEHLKVKGNFDLLKEKIDDGMAGILFYNFTDTATRTMKLAQESGIRAALINGDVSHAKREKIIEKFQGNKLDLLTIQSQCGGAGINLQDWRGNRPRVGLINLCDSAFHFKQDTGRTYRDGAKSDCLFLVPLAAGTVEAKMRASLNQKFKNLSSLVDGDLYPTNLI